MVASNFMSRTFEHPKIITHVLFAESPTYMSTQVATTTIEALFETSSSDYKSWWRFIGYQTLTSIALVAKKVVTHLPAFARAAMASIKMI